MSQLGLDSPGTSIRWPLGCSSARFRWRLEPLSSDRVSTGVFLGAEMKNGSRESAGNSFGRSAGDIPGKFPLVGMRSRSAFAGGRRFSFSLVSDLPT